MRAPKSVCGWCLLIVYIIGVAWPFCRSFMVSPWLALRFWFLDIPVLRLARTRISDSSMGMEPICWSYRCPICSVRWQLAMGHNLQPLPKGYCKTQKQKGIGQRSDEIRTFFFSFCWTSWNVNVRLITWYLVLGHMLSGRRMVSSPMTCLVGR